MSQVHLCPLCGASSSKERYHSPLPIRECGCGLAFVWPRPSDAELKEIYSEDYYRSWGLHGENQDLPRQMKHRTFASRLQVLQRLLSPGKVLDVGCATGFFLEVARDMGWDVAGVELSSYSAGLAAAKFGDRIFNGALADAAYPDAVFDLVTLSDLVEHIPEPVPFMEEVLRVLKPGGYVMIVTPRLDSLTERVMGGKWSHYKQEHLYYFTPGTIDSCLLRAGFIEVKAMAAPKYLNLAYVLNQFEIYPHPLLTPLLRFLARLTPKWLKQLSVPLRCGEMMVLARKPGVVANWRSDV